MACPICDKPGSDQYRPFCSRRCADIDLGKWLGGAYRVAGTRPEDIEEALDRIARGDEGEDS